MPFFLKLFLFSILCKGPQWTTVKNICIINQIFFFFYSKNVFFFFKDFKNGPVREICSTLDEILRHKPTRVEWFSFLAIFENGHIAIDWIFLFNPKIGEFCHLRSRRTRDKVFILKNHRDLKMNIFFESLKLPFTY